MNSDKAPANLVPLWDENQAAEFLALRPATLQRWRWAGIGPAFRKIGRAVRYAPQDLQTFVAASVRTSTSDGGSIL